MYNNEEANRVELGRRGREAALFFTDKMKIGNEPGIFAAAPGGGEGFYGSYHAAHVWKLFGRLEENREAVAPGWIEYLKTYEKEDGSILVRSQAADDNPIVPGIAAKLHCTRGYYWSLRVLGGRPSCYPTFIEPLLSPKTLRKWTLSHGWENAWSDSNQVLAVATILQGLRDWFDEPGIDRLLEEGMLPALEEVFDKETGLWGGPRWNAPVFNGLFATIHIVPIYYSQGWEVQATDRCVDSTLECQLADGSFWNGGANCPDFDGAYMIANLRRLTDYRAEDLWRAAERYVDHAFMHLDVDGRGWHNKRRDYKRGKDEIIPEFTMLDAWFYPLSLAVLEKVFPSLEIFGEVVLEPASLHECCVFNTPRQRTHKV